MKKKSDTARECAEQLKPFGKTIEDATDFYVRHLQRKKSTGRPPGTGALSGIKPRMEWADIRKRIRNPAFEAGGRQFESKIAHDSSERRLLTFSQLRRASGSKNGWLSRWLFLPRNTRSASGLGTLPLERMSITATLPKVARSKTRENASPTFTRGIRSTNRNHRLLVCEPAPLQQHRKIKKTKPRVEAVRA